MLRVLGGICAAIPRHDKKILQIMSNGRRKPTARHAVSLTSPAPPPLPAARRSPATLHPPVTQRGLEAEIALCVGGVVSPVLANLFLHWAFGAWMGREFPDCPFERYADDGLIHCKSQARARQVLAALEQRMTEVGLDLHPDKTQIIYCKDSARRKPWDGAVSSGFLGYAFRPRDTMGKNGRFTGSGLAVSPKAVKRMTRPSPAGGSTGSPTSPGNSSRAGSARSSAGGSPTTAGSAIRCWTRCSPGSTTTSRNGSGANTGGCGPTGP